MMKQQQTRSSTGSSSDLHEKISDSMKKKFWLREFFFALYNISRIALSIAIIVLISSTDHKTIQQNKQYQRTQEILEIWSKDVIIDMITVSTYNCPKGYEPYTSASWEGTKQGCLCATSINQYDYVHVIPGQCSLKLISAGCTRIKKQSSIPFVFWRIKRLICVKRIKGLNFYTNLSQFLPKTDLKNCSEYSNFRFQSLKSQKCPITVISNTSTAYPYVLPEIEFSFNRQSSYPIVDIKMSQYSFCQQYNKQNISPNRFENYDLQVIEISNCADDNDPRVKEIDQITQKLLFQNNQRIHDIITFELPIYPKPNDMYIYKLGTVEYPPWSIQCRQSENYNLQKTKNILIFDEAVQKSQTCIYLTAIMVSIWGFLFSIINIIKRIIELRSRYKNGILFYPDSAVIRMAPNLMPNQLKLSIGCQIIIFIMFLLIALGLLLQIGIQYEYVSSLEEWIRNSFQCMDGSTYFQQWISQGYLSFLQFSIRYYLICILSAIVVVCIDIIYLIWRFNKGDLQDDNIRDLFASDDLQQKNSDEELSNRRDKQLDKEISVDDNQFPHRQETGDIDISGLRDQQIESKKYHKKSPNKKNVRERSRGQAYETKNPTQESFEFFDQDKVSIQKMNSEIGKIKSRSKNKPLKVSHLQFEED